MNPSIIHTGYMALAFGTLFGSAELLYHRFHFKAELTRKYVHIFTGVLTMLFPLLIHNQWLILALCASFLFILLGSIKFNLLPSINGVDRVTRGSILYPIIVFSCYIFYIQQDQLVYYYIPILLLALCDPVAALVGKKWPWGRYTTLGYTKTLSGSFGFFVAAFITSYVLIWQLEDHPTSIFIIAMSLALTTTIAEAFTHKGYDNLTIPASAILTLYLLQNYF